MGLEVVKYKPKDADKDKLLQREAWWINFLNTMVLKVFLNNGSPLNGSLTFLLGTCMSGSIYWYRLSFLA